MIQRRAVDNKVRRKYLLKPRRDYYCHIGASEVDR